jgi:transcriptional regulator with XRE-family HTH domain
MPKRPERPTGFAQRLRELREAAGLTQEQLAERAGLYPFSLAKLEQGVHEPTWPTVLDLGAALGVEVGAFVCEDRDRLAPKRRPGRPRKISGDAAGDMPAPQHKPARRKSPRPRGE